MKKMKKMQYPPLRRSINRREKNTSREEMASVKKGIILKVNRFPKQSEMRLFVILYPSYPGNGSRLDIAVARFIMAKLCA